MQSFASAGVVRAGRSAAVPPRPRSSPVSTMSSVRAHHDGHAAGFRHEAMPYRGEREFLDGTLRFVREGAADGEPVLVLVAAAKIAALRAALGAEAACVRFEDMALVGANPARIFAIWRAFARDAAASGHAAVRGIGEPIVPGRSAAELFECHRHELLLNLAFADDAAPALRLLCPYDIAALDSSVVAQARSAHPLVHDPTDGRVRASASFVGLEAAALPCDAPLPLPPSEAQTIPIMPAGLMALRAAVARRGERAGLSPMRREDLVLAVNELATNSIRHGGGAGTLTIWETAEALVCEVTDRGQIEDPLAGREPPELGQVGRYGLWLVNRLCDLTEQRTHPRGNVVRVTMRRVRHA